MGSVHNDLHTWAGKARRRGLDTIEIDLDTADRAAQQIVDLSNRVMDLEHQARRDEARPPKAWYIESKATPGECWELIEGREPTEYIGEEAFTITPLWTDAAPTPMGGEVEALREAANDAAIALRAVLEEPEDNSRRPHAWHYLNRLSQALAALQDGGA